MRASSIDTRRACDTSHDHDINGIDGYSGNSKGAASSRIPSLKRYRFLHAKMYRCKNTSIYTYIHKIHTRIYKHTSAYINTYIHKYIYIYAHTKARSGSMFGSTPNSWPALLSLPPLSRGEEIRASESTPTPAGTLMRWLYKRADDSR